MQILLWKFYNEQLGLPSLLIYTPLVRFSPAGAPQVLLVKVREPITIVFCDSAIGGGPVLVGEGVEARFGADVIDGDAVEVGDEVGAGEGAGLVIITGGLAVIEGWVGT